MGRKRLAHNPKRGEAVKNLLHQVWMDDEGQDIAEYALMLAVILVVVIGAVRSIGSGASDIFSATAEQLTT